jgi:hypothetical protein
MRHLPWLDGGAGLVVGVVVLLAQRPLTGLYSLPHETVLAIGVANVLYSSLGLSLGPMRPRRAWVLTTLVVANVGWAVVCLVLAVAYAHQVSAFGLAHVLGEGLFCASLAVLERRHRGAILGVS